VTHQDQRGFSLIELLVAISLTSVLLLSVGNFVTDSIRSSNQDYNQTLVFVNTKSAVEIVARAIREARAVQPVNSLPDNYAPGAPGDLTSWSGTAGNGATLILAVPSRDTSNNLIYADGLHTNLYTDDVIFYLNSSNDRLYKRTIANPNAPDNRAKTTCPPANATTACPADQVIVEDVANLTTAYLDGSGATTTTPSGTEAVRYTVTESKLIGPRTYSSSYTTTAAMRNK
jgi:prepilin-type N-terminal cleavage/methylation domain-containing protein